MRVCVHVWQMDGLKIFKLQQSKLDLNRYILYLRTRSWKLHVSALSRKQCVGFESHLFPLKKKLSWLVLLCTLDTMLVV